MRQRGKLGARGLADFRLSEADTNSGLWLRLKTHLTERLDLLRIRNDGDRSEIETAALRGEIRCLKQIIALDAPAIATGDEDTP